MGRTSVQKSAANDKATSERLSLETAFQSFSEVSTQLSESYQHLQNHVSELQRELVESNKEKLQASIDRHHISSRLEHLLALLPGGVVVIDSKGVVQQCNPAAEDLLGGALLGKRWTHIIEQNFSPRSDDGHEISLVDGRRLSIATRSMTGVGLPGGNGQLILLTDQTETRELQTQLSRQDRLTTMGKMVAYLAHQIRTPLSSAMLYAGHLKNENLPAEQKAPFAEKLVRQLRNLEQQISDLLIFARGSQAAEQEIRVSDLLLRLEREVRTTPNLDAVRVTYCNQAPESELTCNPSALISAILNLLNNAREANLETGHVSILEITVTACVLDNWLRLVIEDNGPGINQTEIGRVLEPFYSTKAKGTGLGLAVVQAVAKSLGGDLSLGASCSGGLKVELSIPVSIEKKVPKKWKGKFDE